jgi:hypothetical protein
MTTEGQPRTADGSSYRDPDAGLDDEPADGSSLREDDAQSPSADGSNYETGEPLRDVEATGENYRRDDG